MSLALRWFFVALLAVVAFVGLSLDIRWGDLRYDVGGKTLRHWSLVNASVEWKAACATGIVRGTSGGPCGGGGATAYTLSGPSSGTINATTANYTVQPVGSLAGTVVVTPADASHGGVFAPTTDTLTGSSPQTFTYTPLQPGTFNISTTNGGGLTNPSPISFTSPNIAPGFPTESGWTGGSFEVVATGQSPDPFGGANAVKITESTDNGPHKAGSNLFSFTSGQTYVATLYVHTGTGTRALNYWVGAGDSSSANNIVIDPSSCNVTSSGFYGGSNIASTATRTANLGAGWCLAQMTMTLPFTGNGWIQLFMNNAGSESYIGDGSSSVITYGPVIQ